MPKEQKSDRNLKSHRVYWDPESDVLEVFLTKQHKPHVGYEITSNVFAHITEDNKLYGVTILDALHMAIEKKNNDPRLTLGKYKKQIRKQSK